MEDARNRLSRKKVPEIHFDRGNVDYMDIDFDEVVSVEDIANPLDSKMKKRKDLSIKTQHDLDLDSKHDKQSASSVVKSEKSVFQRLGKTIKDSSLTNETTVKNVVQDERLVEIKNNNTSVDSHCGDDRSLTHFQQSTSIGIIDHSQRDSGKCKTKLNSNKTSSTKSNGKRPRSKDNDRISKSKEDIRSPIRSRRSRSRDIINVYWENNQGKRPDKNNRINKGRSESRNKRNDAHYMDYRGNNQRWSSNNSRSRSKSRDKRHNNQNRNYGDYSRTRSDSRNRSQNIFRGSTPPKIQINETVRNNQILNNNRSRDQIKQINHISNRPTSSFMAARIRPERKRHHGPHEEDDSNFFLNEKNNTHYFQDIKTRNTNPPGNKFSRQTVPNDNSYNNHSFTLERPRFTGRGSNTNRPPSLSMNATARETLDLRKSSVMNDDELAYFLHRNKACLNGMLETQKDFEDISLLLNTLGRTCQGSGSTLIEDTLNVVKKWALFDRSDVKKTIYNLRSGENGTLNTSELTLLKNIIALIKGLTEYVQCGPTDLCQPLDSLEFGAVQFLTDEDEKRAIIDTIISIRESWKTSKFNNTEAESSLSILPTLDEIEIFQHSDVSDKYVSSEDYLQRLFLVHRQDFVRPLCRGLLRLRADLAKDYFCVDKRWKHDDIRVYPGVHLLSRCCNLQNGVTWRIQFDVSLYQKVNWTTRKLLTYGSLVCLSNRSFTFLVYAIVAERQPKDLPYGVLEIKFKSAEDETNLKGQPDMILIESQAFFPSYYHTLASLKGMHSNILMGKGDLPFCSQLVHLNAVEKKPNFLNKNWNEEKGFFFPEFGFIDITDANKWPSPASLKMDESQHAAFFSSINRSLAIIQGPPGTGKTVVGLKIAEVLLKNESIWHLKDKNAGPLLLLSYTNHALDQFLVEIGNRLSFEDQDVIRLGSRSDVESLQRFNLTEHRKKRYNYYNVTVGRRRNRRNITRREVANIHNVKAFESKQNLSRRIKAHTDLQKMRETLLTGIADLKWLLEVANVVDFDHYRSIQHEGSLLDWLDLEGVMQSTKSANRRTQKMDTFEEDEFAYLEPEDNLRSCLYDDQDEDDNMYYEQFNCNLDINNLRMLISDELKFVQNNDGLDIYANCSRQHWLLILQTVRNKLSHTRPMTDFRIRNIWDLSIDERWDLYMYWVKEALVPIEAEIENCETDYKQSQDTYSLIQQTADINILKNAKLIACTTTRAARDIEILKRVSPSIILVEEAAEIPEHHVVSCLTASCQQLIMIGDHQQLRPSFNDYHTAREHKINISLFERLIRAGFPFKRLQYQHRMRPAISQLLVPYIYKSLSNDESVFTYKDIKGMRSNIFFMSHETYEDNERDEASKSHKNTHEATMMRGLYRYLRMQGYKSSQITILSPYLDQIRLLRSLIMPVDNEFSNNFEPQNEMDDFYANKPRKNNSVRITAVDNFQGEENDIILLSLVRSNKNERIGYLSEPNRICVSLSRAKQGLFVIGNFNLLKKKSDLWGEIINDATGKDIVGYHFPLSCVNHSRLTPVSKVDDFKPVADGGCSLDCNFKKPCGHRCTRKCHPDDIDHLQYHCENPCKEIACERGHRCTSICHYPDECPQCEIPVQKIIPKCGHSQMMSCFKDPSQSPCKSKCEKIISCAHQCQKHCSDDCNTGEQCNELIKTKCRNGHELQVACREKHDLPCKIPCDEILKCGHKCSGTCGDCSQGRLHIPCKKKCDRNLVCGHICPGLCHNNCPPCKHKCVRSCAHRDGCKRHCGDACISCRDQCNWKCLKSCPNKFDCDGLCHEICERPKCNSPCFKLLKCDHKCRGLLCEKKCLTVCGICDKEKLTEILFGTEDEDDAVFIQLDDCKCFYEVTGLDQYIESQIEGFKRDGINCLKCLKCRKNVTSSSRYRNELKLINRDIESIFETIRNTDKLDVYGVKMAQVFTRINNINNKKDKSQLTKMVEQVRRSKSSSQLHLLTDRLSFLEQINNLQTNIMMVDHSGMQVILANLKRLKQWTFEKRTQFSGQEHDEFFLEVRRLQLQIDISKFWKELQVTHTQCKVLPQNIQDIHDKIQSGRKIDEEEISRMRGEFVETSSKLIGLTFEEKQMIKRTMDDELRGSGHWYKCANGHMYCIGECGMPMEQRKCPYCDSTIGGTNHNFTEQNDRAMDMDSI